MLVESQPVRPERDPTTGELLNYRTHVTHAASKFNPYGRQSFLAQIRLYRWIKSEDYVNMVATEDLVEFLNFGVDPLSKSAYGEVQRQSVRYLPKMLKGKTLTNPKPRWCLSLHNRLDLEYGLEWMICLWMRHMETDLEDALEELATCNDRDCQSLFVDEFEKLRENNVIKDRPNWMETWKQFELEHEPIRTERAPGGARPILKSVDF